MNRFLFFCSTLFIGLLAQFLCTRYLSLYEAAPQILLLMVVAHGFIYGPVMGETLGFFMGLLSVSMGANLFGMNAFLLSLAGFIAGSLRRRVASERLTAQLVVAGVSTLLYVLGASWLYSIFKETGERFSFLSLLIVCAFNALFISVIFNLTERWVDLWSLNREHV